MNYFLPRVGGLLRPEVGEPVSTPTTSTTMTTTQEMKPELQRYCSEDLLDSSYSDNIGFPTLPRPKTILSVSCGGRGPLQSPRVSAGSTRRNGWLKDKKLEGLHPVATTSVKVNNLLLSRGNLSKQTGTGSSSNGVAATGSCYSKAECESSSLEHPRRSVSISSSSEISMSNKSRVLARKVQAADASEGEDFKSKKRRSMTFSFGSNSERKKRSLSFLRKGEKKGEKKGAAKEKVASLPPDSPILVTKKNQTMPVATASTELPVPDKAWREDVSQLKYNGSACHQPKSGSYQDISRKTASPQLEHKFRPPNLSLSSSARGYSTPGDDEESPVLLTEYSPALSSNSGLSSFRNSPEPVYNGSAQGESSGPLAAPVTPSGKRHSLNPSPSHSSSYRLDVTPPMGERKFSDPAPSTPEPRRTTGVLSSSCGARGIKKRYTFCVRPSQDTKQRRWVSGWWLQLEISGNC